MERERKTQRARTREEAVAVTDRFLAAAPRRGQHGQQPPTTRDPNAGRGRMVPPRELIQGNRNGGG